MINKIKQFTLNRLITPESEILPDSGNLILSRVIKLLIIFSISNNTSLHQQGSKAQQINQPER